MDDEAHKKIAKLVREHADVLMLVGSSDRYGLDLKQALTHLDDYLHDRPELPQIVFVPNYKDQKVDPGYAQKKFDKSPELKGGGGGVCVACVQ